MDVRKHVSGQNDPADDALTPRRNRTSARPHLPNDGDRTRSLEMAQRASREAANRAARAFRDVEAAVASVHQAKAGADQIQTALAEFAGRRTSAPDGSDPE
ncbi:hypothetical protein JANAI62_16980 [Jannaschia pagri]|uniref:Methyl-accepting chemotaxis protein n=1 Tax=Jannaschia pagri TaxID=2829797 RepID=A0ABQ4NKY3_9RHOB|nr:hypothetical protein JANAI61_17010 [Jannaschia sp. AI_61]GIT95075.1 hypothetical protein JANAI62_16980 [Jannaschia sp. AI_62]